MEGKCTPLWLSRPCRRGREPGRIDRWLSVPKGNEVAEAGFSWSGWEYPGS
jgi:hypothetical protein